jgi:predicted DNA-binding transcriptional regulator AlpA
MRTGGRWPGALSVADLAEYLGISRASAHRIVASGELPSRELWPENPPRKRGLRVLREDVDAWLRSLPEREVAS